MLLTITTTYRPTTDLAFLLHKHPDRFQSFDLSFGHARVFYPELGEDRITAALMLDVDPVGMVRGRNADQGFSLGQYVNDRPTKFAWDKGTVQYYFLKREKKKLVARPPLTRPVRARVGRWYSS